MARTDAQVLMAQGRREGRLEERRETLLEQLEIKFGPLSEAVVMKVNALTYRKLKELSRRFVTAQSLEELGL